MGKWRTSSDYKTPWNLRSKCHGTNTRKQTEIEHLEVSMREVLSVEIHNGGQQLTRYIPSNVLFQSFMLNNTFKQFPSSRHLEDNIKGFRFIKHILNLDDIFVLNLLHNIRFVGDRSRFFRIFELKFLFINHFDGILMSSLAFNA